MRASCGVARRESTTTRSGWQRRGDEPHVQPRVVVEHGADAGQDCAGTLAPGMSVGARGLAGDPLARAVVERAAAVERDSRLHAQPRPAALHAREEADVEFARLAGEQPDVDADARGAQPRDAFPGNERVRVARGNDDPRQAGGDQCVAARRRAAVVRAGLQADVGGRAADRLATARRHRAGPSPRRERRRPAVCGRCRSRDRRPR